MPYKPKAVCPFNFLKFWGLIIEGTAEIKEYQHRQPPGSNQQPFDSQSNALPKLMDKKIFTFIPSNFFVYQLSCLQQDKFFTNLKYFSVKIKLDNSCESSA